MLQSPTRATWAETVVSPEKLLLSRPVDMVVIPASESDMGVLAGHTPTIVMLRGGLISLYEGDRVTDTLFVAGCFADVTPERCTVLAKEVSPVAELNKAVGEQRLDPGPAGEHPDRADTERRRVALAGGREIAADFARQARERSEAGHCPLRVASEVVHSATPWRRMRGRERPALADGTVRRRRTASTCSARPSRAG